MRRRAERRLRTASAAPIAHNNLTQVLHPPTGVFYVAGTFAVDTLGVMCASSTITGGHAHIGLMEAASSMDERPAVAA